MRRVENPELKSRIIQHLIDQYKIIEVREPNHLSTYVYCRTRGFFDQHQAISPTEQEVLLFSLGYGLQDVLTPTDAEAPVIEKEGVIYRPDMMFMARSTPTELKTTRKSAKKHFIDEEISESWLDYMKGGCKILDTTEYELIVLYMMGNYSPPFPQIYADTFIFEQEEIDENWNKLMERKAVMDKAIETNVPPEPFQNCYDWECQYCRYKLMCETIVQAQQDIKNYWPEES